MYVCAQLLKLCICNTKKVISEAFLSAKLLWLALWRLQWRVVAWLGFKLCHRSFAAHTQSLFAGLLGVVNVKMLRKFPVFTKLAAIQKKLALCFMLTTG